MHEKRVLSAVVFIPFFIILVLKGYFFFFWLLITIVACTGLREFYYMLEKTGIETFNTFGVIISIVLSLCYAYTKTPHSVLVAAICFSIFLFTLMFYEDFPGGMRKVCGTLFGIIYVPFLLYHFFLIWKLPHGRHLVLALVALIWMGDSGAYYIGKKFGKRKMASFVSPNKTLEGVWGGLAGNLLCAAVLKLTILPEDIGLIRIILISITTGIIGQFGDLFESFLKRASSVKDSSMIIPGHGGVLDRLDSLLFAAPFFLYMIK